MALAKVKVYIPKGGNGQTFTKAAGFPGQTCRNVTGPIIQALGGEVTEDDNTSEVVEQVQVLEGSGVAAQ